MEQKWVCKMPQNLGVENAPTTSLARPQSPSTGWRQRSRRGHSFGLTPRAAPMARPFLCPGQGTNSLCPVLPCVQLLWAPHTRAWGTASSSHQGPQPLAPLSWLQGAFSRLLLCWEVSPDWLAPAAGAVSAGLCLCHCSLWALLSLV